VKKLKKNNKNKRIALYIFAAVILVALLYFINNPITGNTIVNVTTIDYSRSGNPDFYSLLPPKPSDFNQIKLMWENGIIRDDPNRINESYWKQPEWFPKYEETFLPSLESMIRMGDREPIWSLGIFDSQTYRKVNQEWLKNPYEPKTSGFGEIKINNDSVTFVHRFWVRAVPGAVKHFGIGLYVSYPQESTIYTNAKWGISGGNITQDPSITEKYIKAKTYESSSGKTEFTLGTYWPQLDPDYVKEVYVEAEIRKDAPKGNYIIEADEAAPSKEYQQEQSLKYGLSYTDPNIGMFRGPNHFRLFIEIV